MTTTNLNKILVNEEYLTIENNVVELDIQVAKVILTIKGRVMINDLSVIKTSDITINLEKNSYLIYNKFTVDQENNNITINGNANNIIEYNYSILSNKKTRIVINYHQKENSSKCHIQVKGVAKNKGQLFIEANGIISRDTKDNEYLENIRILTMNEEQHTILPNLLVDTNNVIASHNATIAPVNKNDLFYFNTKGISNIEATKLITNGFLLSSYDNLEIIDKIRNLINKEV